MRYPDWPTRLQDYIDSQRDAPFRWVAHDCVAFAAGAVRAVSTRAVELPPYQTARQAARLIAAAGGLPALVAARLGPPIPPASAQRGDLLLLHQRRADLLAVCLGHLWAAPGPDGVAFGPAADAVQAWRID